MHFNRSRSRIANVTLVFCRICSLQTPKRDPETTRLHHRSGHLNLARSGHLNLAATLALRIMYIMSNLVSARKIAELTGVSLKSATRSKHQGHAPAIAAKLLRLEGLGRHHAGERAQSASARAMSAKVTATSNGCTATPSWRPIWVAEKMPRMQGTPQIGRASCRERV